MKVEKILRPAPSKVIKVAIITPPQKVVKPIVKPTAVPVVPPVIPPPLVKKVEQKKPTPIVKPKKIVKKKIIKKKIVKKKIVKKKVVKKVKAKKIVKKKKVIKKKVIAKKIIKKPIRKEPIVEYTPPPAPPVYVAPKPIPKPKATPAPTQVAQNNHHKKAFLRNVRSKIIANKKYPKIAKRRHIEGSVKVRFDITKYGQVRNIRFINGKSVFHKSIRKTLERTFPMGIPNEVKSQLPITNVSVVLHFNIR